MLLKKNSHQDHTTSGVPSRTWRPLPQLPEEHSEGATEGLFWQCFEQCLTCILFVFNIFFFFLSVASHLYNTLTLQHALHT